MSKEHCSDLAMDTCLHISGVFPLEKQEDFYCYICERVIFTTKAAIKHVEIESHVMSVEWFNRDFKRTHIHIKTKEDKCIKCKACLAQLGWCEVKAHADVHNITPWYKPKDVFRLYFDHSLFLNNDEIYCHICNYSMQNHWRYAMEHIKSQNHISIIQAKNFLDKTVKEEILEESTYIQLVKNAVGRNRCFFYCYACNSKFKHLFGVLSHIDSKKHTTNRSKIQCLYLVRTPEVLKEVDVADCKLNIPSDLISIIKEDKIQVYPNELHCNTCRVKMLNDSAIQSHLARHVKQKMKNLVTSSLNTSDLSINTSSSSLLSLMSNDGSYIDNKTQGTQNNAQPKSINTQEDYDKCLLKIPDKLKVIIEEDNVKVYPTMLYCNMCKVTMNNESAVNSHLARHEKGRIKEAKAKSASTSTGKLEKSLREALLSSVLPPAAAKPSITVLNKELMYGPQVESNTEQKPGSSKSDAGSGEARTEKTTHNVSLKYKFNKNHDEETVTDDKEDMLDSIFISDMNNSVALLNVNNEHSIHNENCASNCDLNIKIVYDLNPEKLRVLRTSLHLSILLDCQCTQCLVCDKKISKKFQSYYEHVYSTQHLENLQRFEEDDKKFRETEPPTAFQILQEGIKFSEHEDIGHCLLCNDHIEQDDQFILTHIALKSHEEKNAKWKQDCEERIKEIHELIENSWYTVQKYRCIVCLIDFISEIEFATHLNNKNHAARPATGKRIKLGDCIFDSCIPCMLLWYGPLDFYETHCKSVIHKYMVVNGCNLANELPEEAEEFLKSYESNVQELLSLSDKVSRDDREKERNILKDLKNTVKMYCEKARAFVVGSRLTDMGLPGCNVNIFLDTGDSYCTEKTHLESQDLLKMISSCSEKNKDVWNVKEIDSNDCTPLLKAWHTPTQMHCEISCSNRTFLKNTIMIKNLSDAYPDCRKIILFLKKWLHLCNLNQFNNNIIIWCIIYYLQTLSIYPGISEILTKSICTTNGWEIKLCHDSPRPEATLTFKELLLGFFSFYANFDYRHKIISPLLGATIKKEACTYFSQLSDKMTAHTKFPKTPSRSECFAASPMCIQNPFDVSHNYAYKVEKNTLNDFRIYCNKSIQVLKSLPSTSN